MRIINFKDFVLKYNLKDDTMNQSELQTVNNYAI